MEAEYDSLLQNDTRRLVSLPSSCKPMMCKWVYRVKTNFDGFVAKFKVRIVAKDYTQKYGVDYDQTVSPIVKYESIQTVLAIAAQQHMIIVHLDIQTAFLHGFLDT